MSSSSSKSETCQAWVDGVKGEYGYKPSLAAGIVLSAIFGLSMTVHIIQACWKRAWWTNLFAIGALG
ncbi:RTA1-domain-containing protein [Penicillium angulare]|uniref:RTA1-domain-containing protein n=1 Tax=Penicillium angulare TaxID=116970 RepID=UPI002540AAB8|nr:RTA1-domain-containing protein [Penicillium angulare]KAJ5261083.1 RTA1-domain-containing protein [Penicillium angulare]